MISRQLVCHRDTPCGIDISIRAEITREAGRRLTLRYWVEGEVGLIRDHPILPPGRTDGLWRHTCFEAFLRAAGEERYHEFNFRDYAWASYSFDRYREGMRDAPVAPVVGFTGEIYATYLIHARLGLEGLSDLSDRARWQLGLAAVIEEANGNISYWALQHPPGTPDFHHPDCFAIELPAIQSSSPRT